MNILEIAADLAADRLIHERYDCCILELSDLAQQELPVAMKTAIQCALKHLRKPSPEMIEAAQDANRYEHLSVEMAQDTWAAMIDVLLKDYKAFGE